jgi:hypothetical protein
MASTAPHEVAIATRELPHSLDLERAVLANLLDGRSIISIQKVRPVVEHPLVFFSRDHRIIFQACLELDDGNHPLDLQAVAELLSRYRFQAIYDTIKRLQLLLEAEQINVMGRQRLKQMWRREATDATQIFHESALAGIGGYTVLGDIAQSFAPSASLERNAELLRDYYLNWRPSLPFVGRATILGSRSWPRARPLGFALTVMRSSGPRTKLKAKA